MLLSRLVAIAIYLQICIVEFGLYCQAGTTHTKHMYKYPIFKYTA